MLVFCFCGKRIRPSLEFVEAMRDGKRTKVCECLTQKGLEILVEGCNFGKSWKCIFRVIPWFQLTISCFGVTFHRGVAFLLFQEIKNLKKKRIGKLRTDWNINNKIHSIRGYKTGSLQKMFYWQIWPVAMKPGSICGTKTVARYTNCFMLSGNGNTFSLFSSFWLSSDIRHSFCQWQLLSQSSKNWWIISWTVVTS